MYVPKLQITLLALSEFPEPVHATDYGKVHAAALAKVALLRKLGHDVDDVARYDVGNVFTNLKNWFGPEFNLGQVKSKVKRDTLRAYTNKAYSGDGRTRPVKSEGKPARKRPPRPAKKPEPAANGEAPRTTGGLDIRLLASSVAFLRQFPSLESCILHVRNAHDFQAAVAAQGAKE